MAHPCLFAVSFVATSTCKKHNVIRYEPKLVPTVRLLLHVLPRIVVNRRKETTRRNHQHTGALFAIDGLLPGLLYSRPAKVVRPCAPRIQHKIAWASPRKMRSPN